MLASCRGANSTYSSDFGVTWNNIETALSGYSTPDFSYFPSHPALMISKNTLINTENGLKKINKIKIGTKLDKNNKVIGISKSFSNNLVKYKHQLKNNYFN